MANINKDGKVVDELYNRITWLETEYAFLYDDYIHFINSLKDTPSEKLSDIITDKIESLIIEVNKREE